MKKIFSFLAAIMVAVSAMAAWDGTVTSSLDDVTMKSVSEIEGITLTFNGAESIVVNSIVQEGDTIYGSFECWNPDFSEYYIWSPYYGSTYEVNGDQITLTDWKNANDLMSAPAHKGAKRVALADEGETDYQFEMMDYGSTFVIDGEEYMESIDLFFNAEKQEPVEPFAVTVSNNGVEGTLAGVEASEQGVMYQFNVLAEGKELREGTAAPSLYIAEKPAIDFGAASLIAYEAEVAYVRFSTLQQPFFTEAGTYVLTIPEGTFVDEEGTPNAETVVKWVIIENEAPKNIVVESVVIDTVLDNSWDTNDIYYTATAKFAKPAGAVFGYCEGMHMELNGENTGVPFTTGMFNLFELGEGDSVTVVFKDNMLAATEDPEYEGDIRPAGSYVASFEIMFQDENYLEIMNDEAEVLTATFTGSVVLPNLYPVELGEITLNVADQEITEGDLLVNGIKLNIEAQNVTPEMNVKAVATLYTAIPTYGQPEGLVAPQFEAVLDSVEFVGGINIETGAVEVDLTEFVQYAYEAGAGNVYMVRVHSVEVLSSLGVEDAWYEDEEAVVGGMFAVVETLTLGTPVLNVLDQELTMNELAMNGVKLTFEDAQLVTDEMTVRVMASLYTAVPTFGQPEAGVAPQFEVVLDSVVFTGGADLETGVIEVKLDEFTQYAYEAGAGNVYMVRVLATAVLAEDGELLYEWAENEEDLPVGGMFAIKESVTLGTPVLNVADAEVTTEDLVLTGIKLTFEDAILVDEDMTVKVVASLYQSVPGFGQPGVAPQFEALMDSVEFVGGMDIETGIVEVNLAAFTETVLEGVPGVAYQVLVLATEVVDGEETVYSWVASEEEPAVGGMFAYIELPVVDLGTPVLNVANAEITEEDLLVNGIKLTFDEAVFVEDNMLVRVMASLYTAVPTFGQPEGGVAPQFEVVMDSVIFTGGVDVESGEVVVNLTEFSQYVYEAGPTNIFMVRVLSTAVVAEDGEELLYEWVENEEEPAVGGMFAYIELPVVDLGTPVLNVADQEITVEELLLNGIKLTFDEAVFVTEDMTVRAMATLYTAVPTYGQEAGVAPQFEAVLDSVIFTGDVDVETGVVTVNLTEFVQYAYEAGAGNVYMVRVLATAVLAEDGELLYEWAENEEEPAVGGMFAVKEGLILDIELDADGYVVTPNLETETYVVLLIDQAFFESVEQGIAAMLPNWGNHMLVSGVVAEAYNMNNGFYGEGDYWVVAAPAYYDEEEEELVQNGEAAVKEVTLDNNGKASYTEGLFNTTATKAVKVLRDGQLIIVRENVEYNANGARF